MHTYLTKFNDDWIKAFQTGQKMTPVLKWQNSDNNIAIIPQNVQCEDTASY